MVGKFLLHRKGILELEWKIVIFKLKFVRKCFIHLLFIRFLFLDENKTKIDNNYYLN